MTELEYAQERAAILATAVGRARWELKQGDPNQALEHLDRAAKQTTELLRDGLIAIGADPAKVEAFLPALRYDA